MTAQILSESNNQRTRCEVWTRVMGYHRPVSHFNIGKKSEHYSRKHFVECKVDNITFCQTYA
ncbi:oxidoreductase [Candidatus Nomurabacteria bacterium]|nr:oxidoreductase [Candidatus Nomurabacteria bacterium]